MRTADSSPLHEPSNFGEGLGGVPLPYSDLSSASQKKTHEPRLSTDACDSRR